MAFVCGVKTRFLKYDVFKLLVKSSTHILSMCVKYVSLKESRQTNLQIWFTETGIYASKQRLW